MAAVMMLFYPKNGMTHLVLIVRNSMKEFILDKYSLEENGKRKMRIFCDSFMETQEGIHPDKMEIIKFLRLPISSK
jgi:hypothetical protein